MTESGSTYRIVLDEITATMVRVPAAVPAPGFSEVSTLRGDEEVLAIINFSDVFVGLDGMFALAPLSDNGANVTFRRTSPVRSIVRENPAVL